MGHILVVDGGNYRHHQEGIRRLYQSAYAGPPYFESFTDQEVDEIMGGFAHSDDGICAVYIEDGRIVGLCGGHSLSNESEPTRLFVEHHNGLAPEQVFYMAEVAVDEPYRRRGIGTALIRFRIAEVKRAGRHQAFIMRTQAEGSNSKSLYLGLGFQMIPGMIQQVETFVSEEGTRKKVRQERIFLFSLAKSL